MVSPQYLHFWLVVYRLAFEILHILPGDLRRGGVAPVGIQSCHYQRFLSRRQELCAIREIHDQEVCGEGEGGGDCSFDLSWSSC